jgi:hypothetical protein
MKALISPIETREQGYRVAEVHETGFEIAQPLFWVDCPNDLIADSKWFDPNDNTFKDFPILQKSIIDNQPVTQGTQTI